MKSRMVPGLIAAVAAMAFIAEGRAETPSTPKPDRGAIEKIVRDYLVEHPEIIEEALKALRAKREIEQRQSDRDAVAANGDALRAHPMTPPSSRRTVARPPYRLCPPRRDAESPPAKAA